MSRFRNKDYFTEVVLGNFGSGFAMRRQFGSNPSVPNGSWEFVDALGQTAHALNAATTIRVKAGGNAADDATGAGARTITVFGVDGSYNELEEDITLAGASASAATSNSFLRVNKVFVKTVGTYGASNTGIITIENSAGGTDIVQLPATTGSSLNCEFTVPTGKIGLFVGLVVTVDSGKSANIRVRTRENANDVSAPMSPAVTQIRFDGVAEELIYYPRGPDFQMAAGTDVWVEAYGNGGTAAVAAHMELLITDA